MIISRLSLGALIPLLVIVLMLPFGAFVVISSYLDANHQLESTSRNLFKGNLAHLAIEIERFSQKKDQKSIQRIISLAGASPSLKHLSLIDTEGKVIFSTRYSWVARKADEVVTGFDAQTSDAVRLSGAFKLITDSKDADVDAYYAVTLDQAGIERDSSHVILYGEYSYRLQSHQLWQAQQEKLMIFIAGLIMLSLLLISLLRHWLQKPLQAIFDFIEYIERGTSADHIQVTGSRDVRRLADTLSSMNVSLKRSQHELRHTYHLLRNLIDSIPDLIFYKDQHGVYLGCNQAFCDFVGKSSPEDLIGTSDFDLFDQELAEFFRHKDQTMLASGEAQKNEEWVTYPDGTHVLLDTLKTPYYNDKGEVIGLIGISRDITDVKQLEEQFHQAQKMEAVGTLVGGIAHDFNNILAGITGNMYLAKKRIERGLSDEAIERISNIEGLSRQAAAMVAQLLAFARKGIVQMQVVSITSFVKESLKLAQVTIPENIQLSHDITSDELLIEGDVTLLQQVLLNLLNNARDAVADEPEARIKISVCHYTPDSDFVHKYPESNGKVFAHLSVLDNGMGIAKENVDHLFDPFFTTKEVGKGTGLGLSMVYGAVQSHSGIIEVESRQGSGSTFHIYLPVIEKPEKPATIAKMETPAISKGETILIADDESFVRETAAEVLESQGYNVLQAEDGNKAIEVFKAHQDSISLAVLDLVMPHLGGVPLAKKIRKIDPELPVVFVTGYDKEHVLKQEGEIENSQILTKPVDFIVLSHHIRQLLD